jgi:hypothetical protein
VLSGLGGTRDWEAHARETAALLAAAPPHFLRLRTLVLLPETPLYEAWQAGEFEPADPLTRLRETHLLITELDGALRRRERGDAAPGETEVCSDHFSNYVWADGAMIYGGVNGFVPGDTRLLLETLTSAIGDAERGRQVHDPASLARDGRMAEIYRAGRL